jgi:hypothetical protein
MYLVSQGLVPAGLAVEANGQPQPLPSILPLGDGPEGTWWQLRGGLIPGASYVVRISDGAATKELTHFSTAADYDKQMGPAPKLEALRLWRVHYPPSAVAAGGCVFSEYEGYIDLDYQPPALPGTPPEEVVNVLLLSAKTGGESQTLVWSGSERVRLARAEGGSPVAAGVLPSPVFSTWKPYLAPDREYCAQISVFGRGVHSEVPAQGNLVCAAVMSASAPGAPVAGGGPSSDAGCSVGGAGSAGLPLALLALLAFRTRRLR